MNRGISFAWVALGLLVSGSLLVGATRASAQAPSGVAPGAIAGTVTTVDGQPVGGAEVRLVELSRRTVADPAGAFRFEGVPTGSYLVEATSQRLGKAIARVRVTGGDTAEVALSLDLAVIGEEIVVTASPILRSQREVAATTTVITSEQLQLHLQPSLGETLSQQPGVSSTFFGPGASRPVIRGLGGDRIRVLENGIGTGDASTTSPDHAVSLDPISAERIEIVRGPATLLYGSSAVGGVVNVIDERIPTSMAEEPISGILDLRGGTNANEGSGNFSLTGGSGRLAWSLDGLKRQTDDYESGEGTVVNSDIDADGAKAGVSYVGRNGYLGVSAGRYATVYGNPAEEEVTIDLEQRRVDVQGEYTEPFGFLRALRGRFGTTDYEHVELEGQEVGTRFLNDSWEGRLEATQKETGRLEGSFGIQLGQRDFSALGEEAFVPPTQTESLGAFTLQELSRGSLRYQLGLRYETETVDAEVTEGVTSRDLSGISASLGLLWLASDDYGLAVSASRSVKLPNAEELFSNGPHIATNAFEIGDPDLDEEISLGVEASLRKLTGRLTGEINLFNNRFDGFIFDQLTGEIEDDLQVIRFVQRDAEFRGVELDGVYHAYHAEPHHVDAGFGVDYVRAELRDTGEAVPRIPPLRYRLGLHYQGAKLHGGIEGVRVEEQDRVSEFETTTPGYTVLNADLGYRVFAGRIVYDFLLRGNNLTDELAFNHVSFLKDVAPLPGRDLSLAVKLSF